LTIETNGALTAEEVVVAAIEKLNSKVKSFNRVIQSLELPKNV
jgi:DNA-directed RNA polymerase subunit D